MNDTDGEGAYDDAGAGAAIVAPPEMTSAQMMAHIRNLEATVKELRYVNDTSVMARGPPVAHST